MSNDLALPPKSRQRMLAIIHMAKKQLKLDDVEYRDLLESETGKRSAGELDVTGLNKAIAMFEAMGFKVAAKPAGQAATGKKKLSPKTRHKQSHEQIDKVRAQWIELANAGIVRNRYEDGLNAFCKRMFKVERVAWLTPDQASKAIEALKAMEARGKTES